jgi:imidazolonepropionase
MQTLIVRHDGRIDAVGPAVELAARYIDATFESDVDGTGRAMLPGFVDGHTHPVWAGDRCHEFKLKLAGATYMQIYEMGGGIHFTVRATRAATETDLLELLLPRLDRMLSFGTTTVEAKSGV